MQVSPHTYTHTHTHTTKSLADDSYRVSLFHKKFNVDETTCR
jgi:hypothetical protein